MRHLPINFRPYKLYKISLKSENLSRKYCKVTYRNVHNTLTFYESNIVSLNRTVYIRGIQVFMKWDFLSQHKLSLRQIPSITKHLSTSYLHIPASNFVHLLKMLLPPVLIFLESKMKLDHWANTPILQMPQLFLKF